MGRLSLAVDVPPVTLANVAAVDAALLADATVTLQPGVHYFHCDWSLDELISLYLADSAPDEFSLQHGDVWLEIHGARGTLHMNRLSRADYVFRAALAQGASLGAGAASALDIDETFDVGDALLSVVRDGLVISMDAEHVQGVA